MNKYVDFDMAGLDLTLTRDFATYSALSANNQGRNSSLALEGLASKTGGLDLPQWCDSQQKLGDKYKKFMDKVQDKSKKLPSTKL